MYSDRPVRIPEIPGKIFFDRKNDAVYVRYLRERKYDPIKKYNVPKYAEIGIQIENMPTMMIPNGNYPDYFTMEGKEIAAMSEQEMRDAEKAREEENFSANWELFKEYRDFFNEVFYEFKAQSRGRLDMKVPEYQATAINEILEPLQGLLKGETYGRLLELISTGETSYGDAMILLCKYKTALGRYYSDKL